MSIGGQPATAPRDPERTLTVFWADSEPT